MYVGPGGGDGRGSSASNHGGSGGSSHGCGGGGNHGGDYETLSMAGFQRHAQSFSSYHALPSFASVGIPVMTHKGARGPSASTIAIGRRARDLETNSSPSHASWHGTSFDALSAEDHGIDDDMHDVTLTSSPIGSPPSSPWSARRDKTHGGEKVNGGSGGGGGGGGSEKGWKRIERDDPTDDSLLAMTWRPGELTPEQSSEGNEGSSAVTAVGDGYRAYVRTTYAVTSATSTTTEIPSTGPRYSAAATASTSGNLVNNTEALSAGILADDYLISSVDNFVEAYQLPSAGHHHHHANVVRSKSNSWCEVTNEIDRRVEGSTYDGMLLNDLPEIRASNCDTLATLQASSSDVTTPLIGGSSRDFIGTYTSGPSNSEFGYGGPDNDRDLIGLRKSCSSTDQPCAQSFTKTHDQLVQSMEKLRVLEEYGRASGWDYMDNASSGNAFRSRDHLDSFLTPLGFQRSVVEDDDTLSVDFREHRKSMEHLDMRDGLVNSMERLKSSLASVQLEQVVDVKPLGLGDDTKRDLQQTSESAAAVAVAAVNQTVLRCLDSCDKILFRHSTTL